VGVFAVVMVIVRRLGLLRMIMVAIGAVLVSIVCLSLVRVIVIVMGGVGMIVPVVVFVSMRIGPMLVPMVVMRRLGVAVVSVFRLLRASRRQEHRNRQRQKQAA